MSAPKLFKSIGLVVVAVLAVLGTANLFGISPFPSNQSDRSQAVLLKSVKDLSQYHAAAGDFELLVEDDKGNEAMPDFIAGRRTLFIAVGTVDAYVDLAGLTGGDLVLSPDGKSVKVRLPEPQLAKPNIDHDQSRVYSQDRGVADLIVDVFAAPQQAELYQLAETKIAAAAEKSELRERAAKNTKTALTGMFSALGYDVTFEDSSAP